MYVINARSPARHRLTTSAGRFRDADRLLANDTRPFIDSKLRELAAEKRRHQERLDELEAVDHPPIDADAVVRNGLAALHDLPRLLETANIEGRKEFVRAFIGGITVRPDAGVLEVQMKKLPTLVSGNSTCEMVAGARFPLPVPTS